MRIFKVIVEASFENNLSPKSGLLGEPSGFFATRVIKAVTQRDAIAEAQKTILKDLGEQIPMLFNQISSFRVEQIEELPQGDETQYTGFTFF